MHFCVSSISAWWFVWSFCYTCIRNVLLFPTHLMCTRHSISERLRTYSWFQPGSVKFILFCKYSCIPFKVPSHYNELKERTWPNWKSLSTHNFPDKKKSMGSIDRFTNIFKVYALFQNVLTTWKLAQRLPKWQQIINLMYADGFQVLKCNIVRYRLMKITHYQVSKGRNIHNLTTLLIWSVAVSCMLLVICSTVQVTSRYLTENVCLAFT